MPNNNIRYYIFWIIDIFKGLKVYRHFKEIETIQNHYSSDKSIDLRQSYINNLLSHATSTTIFYNNYKGLGITEFPVINKNTIRNNKAQFRSSEFEKKQMKHVSTSGSTGTSISLYHDKNKSNRNIADNIFFYKLADYKIGQKLYYLRIWLFSISTFKMWLKNFKPIDVLRFNEEKYISNLVKELGSGKSSKNILSYASALEKLCVYLDSNNYSPFPNSKVKSVISIAEHLNDYTRERMDYYFNTKVYSRYSNSENGILAQQVINSESDFVINWASYYIEILKLDSDNAAEEGETGRIVVTDLFAYGIPIIRYDTGDLGSIDYSKPIPVFKKVEGRKSDVILNTKGEMVSSMIIIRPHINKGVVQSQLIQEGEKKYTLNLNVTEEFKDESEIRDEFIFFLGEDAQINIEYTNEIPALASGKTRATINNYIKPTIKVN